MVRQFYLFMSLVSLTLAGCVSAVPTAVPAQPTITTAALFTPTLSSIQATETAVPTTPPTLPPATAVPEANTDDLLAIVQAGLPANAFEGLTVLPLYAPTSERPLWAIHSSGFRNFDLDPVPNHFVAVYTYENGDWRELARQNLNPDDGLFGGPDILTEGTVAQADIDPATIWLVVDGYVGAHGGAFQLLRFDGVSMHVEVTGGSASPGVGYLEDLNGDGTTELILRQHEAYVFCYACGVRYLNFQVFTWDTAAQRMVELNLQSPAQDHPAYQAANRAVELARADLWSEALAQIQEAQRLAGSSADPILAWDAALIRLYNDAWQAELNHSPYPLLTHVFYGDYAGALDMMRPYSHDQIFSVGTPLIRGTIAEGYEQWVADYILGQTDAAIAARPDLAAAYYLRAWAAFLLNPANSQIQADLARAAALDPNEPLFANTAVAPANRIQFAHGATSSEINSQIPVEGAAVYVLGAAASQIMTVDLFSQDEAMRLEVHDGGGSWLEGQITPTLWQGELPATADYVIRILDGSPYADFVLRVTIPSRIQFAPGATSAQVLGDLSAHESDDYILRALVGQTMAVVITSPNDNVLLTIVGADGIPLANGLMSGATAWRGQLPATQDYILRAIAAGAATTYTLDVSIE